MRRTALLLMLLLAACARQQSEPAAPENAVAQLPALPATLLAANRLPPRIGAWRRVQALQTTDGYAVLYGLGEGNGRAALMLSESADSPDGPTSPALLRQHRELDPAAPPGAARATLAIADAPGQRCVVRQITIDAPPRRVLDYFCGTAVSGKLLVTRAVVPLQRGDAAETSDADTLVGVLLTAATRALAGIDPPLPRLPAGQSGEAFVGAMRLVREE